MNIKGFILVSATGSYEDYHEEFIAFSESKEELEAKIVELQNSNNKLKRYNETRGISFYYFREYDWFYDNNINFNPKEWIKENPIPEDIIEFVETNEDGSIYSLNLEVPSLIIRSISENYKWDSHE